MGRLVWRVPQVDIWTRTNGRRVAPVTLDFLTNFLLCDTIISNESPNPLNIPHSTTGTCGTARASTMCGGSDYPDVRES